MTEIYLDNSATTPLCEQAKRAMVSALDIYGNPSSLHKVGLAAGELLSRSREKILSTLGQRGAKPENLIFTAGGTEADNLAIFGVAYAKSRRVQNRIITTDSEHSAVESAMKKLEADGFEVVRLSTRGGVIDFDEFKTAMNERTLLVSIMTVNNETGAKYNVKELFGYAKSVNRDVVTHTDAVQGYLKCRLSPAEIGADLVSISSHKIHGPKGVGALYISPEIIKRKQIIPTLLGGGQESGFRSGTENIIGIAGFAAAAEETYKNIASNVARIQELYDYAIKKLSALDVKLNIPKGERAPHIINLTLPCIKSETMLHYLSNDGICVSSGSACSSHGKGVSRALVGFGLAPFDADCSIRVSLSHYNTKEDVDALAESLSSGISRLVRINRK